MSETTNYNFYDAMVEYKMENYARALDIWKSNQGSVGADTLNYYIGMAHLNLKQYEEAEKALSQVYENSSFSDKAKWYALKILMDNKKYTEAKALIKTISPTVHPSFEKINSYLQNQ